MITNNSANPPLKKSRQTVLLVTAPSPIEDEKIPVNSNKQICDEMFPRVEKSKLRCNMCKRSIKNPTGSGYTNALSHLNNDHANYQTDS
jgi:hypothetical protein